MLYLEGKHFLADHNLNYTDKMSMAAGVEVRWQGVRSWGFDLLSLGFGRREGLLGGQQGRRR